MPSPIRAVPALGLAFAVVLAADLCGLAVSLASGTAGLGEALVTGTPLNAPFTYVTVQALAVAAALRLPARRAPAAFLVLLGTVSLASGFFDGGYAAAGHDLGVAERGLQAVLVAATLALTVLAAARLRGGTARPAGAAPAVARR